MQKCCLILFIAVMLILAVPGDTLAQCSICTKTTQQLGEGPAKGFNTGILYLAMTPFLIIGYIGYRWWKNQGE